MRWEFHNDAPIYAQLVERIRRMIVSGSLPPGERLPSVRAFAMEAGVNPNTMQRALTELERDGLVFSQRTAGHFVTEQTETIEAAKQELALRQIRQFLRGLTELGYEPQEAAALLAQQINEKGENTDGDTDL